MEILSMEGWYFLLRWFHFLAGITWIGMLYYFNLVQTPFLATRRGGPGRSPRARKDHVPDGRVDRAHQAGSRRRPAQQRLHDADPDRRPDGHADVVQRLVRDLADPAPRDRFRQRGGGRRSGGPRRREAGAERRPPLAHPHDALDPDALLHGLGQPLPRPLSRAGAERRALLAGRGCARPGAPAPPADGQSPA